MSDFTSIGMHYTGSGKESEKTDGSLGLHAEARMVTRISADVKLMKKKEFFSEPSIAFKPGFVPVAVFRLVFPDKNQAEPVLKAVMETACQYMKCGYFTGNMNITLTSYGTSINKAKDCFLLSYSLGAGSCMNKEALKTLPLVLEDTLAGAIVECVKEVTR